MSRRWRGRLKLTGAASIPLAAVLAVAAAQSPAPTLATAADGAPPPSAAPVARLEELSDAFATVAARVKPSVVFVTAKHEARTAGMARGTLPRGLPRGLPPELEPFFRGIPDGPQRRAPRGGMGSGSGFVVSKDGYILTNSHVVDGASEVRVRLLDRREFDAKVVGTDPSTDVAVLKIEATGLTPAPLADSDAARVGEWVLAVGNPLGENLTFSVTSGIISAKGRALDLPNRDASSIQDFIQTDAAINPGNSGGPLVNVRGEVIGINSAIASPTGTYAGYGFAVPINLAREVMKQLVANGRVERAALGITVREATAEDAAYVGLDEIRGVLVQDYSGPDSPARKAGVQPGDVIVAVDGKPVDYVAQLQERIAFRKPGEAVSLEVARKGGARVTLRVPLQRVADDRRAAASRAGGADDDSRGAAVPSLGIEVAPVDPAVARQLQLPANVRGVIVTDVEEGSAAATRLATPGAGGPDVITSVEGTPVRTPAEFREALAKYRDGDIVTLRVYDVPAKTHHIERVRLGDGR